MMTLFKTEFRQLWPIAGLWVLLELLQTALLFFTTRLDETEYAALCDVFCQPGIPTSAVFILIAIVVWVGWSLFPKDSDDGTLAHLQSLAITRPQIYLAKVLAGFALIVFFYLFSAATSYLFLSLNPQSIHGKFYGAIEGHYLIRYTAFSTIVLCHAIFLSSFRLIGLVLYAGYFVLVSALEAQLGNIGAWNLINLMRVEFHGSTPITDWILYALHGVVAAIALWLGYLRWMKRTNTQSIGNIALSSPWITVPLMIFLFIGLFTYLGNHSNQAVQNRNEAFSSLETDHFRFVYEKNAAPYAEELAEYADGMLNDIAEYLNAQTPPMIQTDLTAKTSHIAGLAVHNRIRMRLRRVSQDTENQFVLAHETAHIYQSSVTSRRLKKAGGSVGFFVEGMAQQVAFTVAPDDERRQLNWIVGALAADRHDIDFDDLVDAETLATKYDAELPYTLGDLWVNTMTEVCGHDSLGKFLDIIGSDNSVLSLQGTSFWRQHLQRIPCELEDINFRFNERVEEIVASPEAQAVPTTASLSLRLDETNEDIFWMDVIVENPFETDSSGAPIAGKDYMVRIKSGASLTRAIDEVILGYPQSAETSNAVSFRLTKDQVINNRFQYQIGYAAGFDYRPIFDKWENAALPRR